MEEELEPNLREDLELLLKNSSPDREIFDGLCRTRQLVKDSADVPLPESGLYYESLHDRIMAALDDEPMIPKVSVGARRSKFAWPAFFGTLMMSAILGVMTWYSTGARDLQRRVAAEQAARQRIERAIASASPVTTAALSGSVLSYQSEADLVADTVAARLRHLKGADMERLIQKLRQ